MATCRFLPRLLVVLLTAISGATTTSVPFGQLVDVIVGDATSDVSSVHYYRRIVELSGVFQQLKRSVDGQLDSASGDLRRFVSSSHPEAVGQEEVLLRVADEFDRLKTSIDKLSNANFRAIDADIIRRFFLQHNKAANNGTFGEQVNAYRTFRQAELYRFLDFGSESTETVDTTTTTTTTTTDAPITPEIDGQSAVDGVLQALLFFEALPLPVKLLIQTACPPCNAVMASTHLIVCVLGNLLALPSISGALGLLFCATNPLRLLPAGGVLVEALRGWSGLGG